MTKRREPQAGDAEPHRDRAANRIIVHQEFLTRRLQGGAPATAEAYARAVDQWQQMAGAVRHIATTGPSSTLASDAHSEGQTL